jgi:hypothetical protein
MSEKGVGECYCCPELPGDGIICGESSQPSSANAGRRLVRSVRNAHGHPNIWPQACEAPIQHQSPAITNYTQPPSGPLIDTSISTMPPKQRTPASVGPQTTTTTSTPARSTKSASGNNAQDILQGIWSKYVNKTPQRVKLLDTFMVFLMVVGALQFLYVVLVGNFVRIHHRSFVLIYTKYMEDGEKRALYMEYTQSQSLPQSDF